MIISLLILGIIIFHMIEQENGSLEVDNTLRGCIDSTYREGFPPPAIELLES